MIEPLPGGVHNHGPEDGPGLVCREYLVGACRLSERPPVDPLRAAAEAVIAEYDRTHLVHDVAYEEVAGAIDALRAALASPAAPGWPRCQDGYDLRTEVCPVCSPAAPRPEGLAAFYHATRQGEPCAHPGGETTPECEVFAAEYQRLSDTGDTP